jgi:hypothetical protein
MEVQMATDINKQRRNNLTEFCPAIRKYKIGGVTYIVTARQSARATEDAKTKIMRLIKNDISCMHGAKNQLSLL